MSRSRTVLAGSALPLLVVVGLAGLPSVRAAFGLQRPASAQAGATRSGSAATRTARPGAAGSDVARPGSVPVRTSGPGTAGSDAARSGSTGSQADRSGSAPAGAASAGDWTDVEPAELGRLRTSGWPCPQGLRSGFGLARVESAADPAGGTEYQLTYTDGRSMISVFLQHGRLDPTGLTGMTAQQWGAVTVEVRAGRPTVLIWQSGPTVITAIGDAGQANLQTALAALPREPDPGTLDSLHHKMGSTLARLKG